MHRINALNGKKRNEPVNNGSAPWLENRLNEHFLFSILASLCSFNELIKEKFSSTIDENFSIFKIQRLIDFHHFLSKSNNEPSQLEFYSKRSHFCFLWWRKLLIGWGNVSLKRVILWESWVLSTILLTKKFVHRWETLSDFIFRR